jgi:uncharacterized protein YjiS (DUF1127 family)
MGSFDVEGVVHVRGLRTAERSSAGLGPGPPHEGVDPWHQSPSSSRTSREAQGGQQLIEEVKEQANKPENRRKLEELRQEGQQLIEQVKEQANKPENRRKLEELRKRYGKRF